MNPIISNHTELHSIRNAARNPDYGNGVVTGRGAGDRQETGKGDKQFAQERVDALSGGVVNVATMGLQARVVRPENTQSCQGLPIEATFAS